MNTLQVYRKKDFESMLMELKNEEFERVVHHIVSKIHNTVVNLAKKGFTEYRWTWADDARFETYTARHTPQLIHLIESCKRLQFLFPDSRVTRPLAWAIEVNWR